MNLNSLVRFQSLDALRFFAFIIVFFSHLPISLSIFHSLDLTHADGAIGVRFFFVLSGFLITYLLLEERKHFNNIKLKYFYIRRILRIWPLYFFIVFLVYVIQPLIDKHHAAGAYTPNWLWTVFFLENIRMFFEDKYPDATLTMIWSICVEEHFYLIWPLVIKYCNLRTFPYILLVFTGIGLMARTLQLILFKNHHIYNVDVFSSFDLFAIGGAVAYITSFKNAFLQQVSNIHSLLKFIFLTITIIAVFFQQTIFPIYTISFIINPLFQGFLFAGVLLIFLSSNKIFSFKESNILSRLGKISYGLYMYHIIVINALFLILSYWGNNYSIRFNGFILTAMSLLLAVFISYISYEFMEKPILQQRKYFIRLKN